MKGITAVIALGILAVGCTSQDTNINFNPTIACDSDGQQKVAIPTDKTLSGGNVMYFEILLDAEVTSKKDSANQPDISPTLSIPLK